MEKQIFEYGSKKAVLYKSAQEGSPLILLNEFTGDGEPVFRAMQELHSPECSLLVVTGLNWDHDLSPWHCPPVFDNAEPFTGGADEYLRLLLDKILPQAISCIPGTPSFLGIAGYSLAGLFALYSLYRCVAFDRAASVSGSLWFPDFTDFVRAHEVRKPLQKVYLSVGSKEAAVRNRYMRTVRTNMEEIASHYETLGIPVITEINPGNHFREPELRTAKGIKTILE